MYTTYKSPLAPSTSDLFPLDKVKKLYPANIQILKKYTGHKQKIPNTIIPDPPYPFYTNPRRTGRGAWGG